MFKRTKIKPTVNILIDPSINCCVYQRHNAHLVFATILIQFYCKYLTPFGSQRPLFHYIGLLWKKT